MNIRFSEDIIPLSDLKANPGKVIRHVSEAHRPGQGATTMQNLRDFEKTEGECSFMRAVVKGMVELDQGRETSLAEVKKRLGLT